MAHEIELQHFRKAEGVRLVRQVYAIELTRAARRALAIFAPRQRVEWAGVVDERVHAPWVPFDGAMLEVRFRRRSGTGFEMRMRVDADDFCELERILLRGEHRRMMRLAMRAPYSSLVPVPRR